MYYYTRCNKLYKTAKSNNLQLNLLYALRAACIRWLENYVPKQLIQIIISITILNNG